QRRRDEDLRSRLRRQGSCVRRQDGETGAGVRAGVAWKSRQISDVSRDRGCSRDLISIRGALLEPASCRCSPAWSRLPLTICPGGFGFCRLPKFALIAEWFRLP